MSTDRQAKGADGLVELLPFLIADGCGLLVALAGYFDESERREGSEPICVAGYLFWPGAYRRFAKHWRRFLASARPGGLSHLHMTDLYAGRGEYSGLGDKRGDILARAVELINAHIHAGVAVVFDQAEFESLAPRGFAGFKGSIYSAACQICLRATGFWLGEHGCHQRVAYTFETGHKFQHEANAILRMIGTTPSMVETHRYQSHSFVDKTQAAGLQAADLLAWTVARTRTGPSRNRTMRLFRPHILALARDGSKYTIQLFSGEKLRRYFLEQADTPDAYIFKKPPEFRGKLR